MANDEEIKREVWALIEKMNRVWTVEGRPEELADYFHENMVALTPADRERRKGRTACVAGWKAFADAATIQEWKMYGQDIVLYCQGRFAVVTYYWEMEYVMNGQTIHSAGRDMFALVEENGRWWVAADQFSAYP